MTDEQLFQILRPHILAVSGVPLVILAAQNQNAPKGPYASLQMRYNNSERGQANISQRNVPDEKVEIEVKPQRVMTCVAEFYRGEAKMFAERLQQLGKREDVTWPLFKHRISIRNVGPVSDLTALQSSNYEQRARVEFVLWMEGSSKYELNNILGVDFELQNEKGQKVQGGEIRLPNP